MASVVVVRIDGDVDAARPVRQVREDVGVPIQRCHLDLLDDRDLIGCFAEQSLIVDEQLRAGAGSGLEDLDLLLQELAPGDDPEWQDPSTCEPPDGRAVGEVELLDALVISLRQLSLVLALVIPAGRKLKPTEESPLAASSTKLVLT